MPHNQDPIYNLEDTLLDLRALLKMGLHYAESSEKDEFNALQSELVTLFYMMLDKVSVCADDQAAIWKSSATSARSGDGLH